MILKKYVFCLSILLLTASCTTGKLWQSDVLEDNIKRLDYLQPVSFIDYIEKGNFAQFNDSLSANSERLIATMLVENRENIPLNNRINTIYDQNRRFIENELVAITDALESGAADFYYLRLSKELVNFMDENNTKHLLGIVANGYMRRPGNYTGQILKSIGIGILTLGMYYPVPIKSSSNLYVMILDAEHENLAFYRKSIMQDKAPLEPEVIDKQLHNIFKGYFYDK